MSRYFLAAAVFVFLSSPACAQKFGISKAQLRTPTLATVSPFSTSTKDETDSPVYGTWSCSNGNCFLVSMPMGTPITTTVAIFKFGPWRVAAACQIDEWHTCTSPKDGQGAWIELSKNGDTIRALFISEKKPVDGSRADKKIHGILNWNRNIWKIVSVHNVDTNETWPKTLQQEMAK
jgi:hypothetical protein